MLPQIKTPRPFVLVLLPLLALSSCAGWQDRLEKNMQRNHELQMAQTQNSGSQTSSNQAAVLTGSGNMVFTFDSGLPSEEAFVNVTKRTSDDYVTIEANGVSISGYAPTLQGYAGGQSYTLNVTWDNGVFAGGTFLVAESGRTETGQWTLR